MKLNNGEWSIDNTPHKYKGKVRYEWEACTEDGRYMRGYAKTKHFGEYCARRWAERGETDGK